MKIGLLSFEYPPETGFGGIGTYTFNHAKGLRQLGHEVHVIAGWSGRHALSRHDADGITVWRGQSQIRPAMLGRVMDRFKLHWSKNRIETAMSMIASVREVHRQHRLEVIEMPECGAEGLLVNHLTEIPAVIRFHSPCKLIMPHYGVNGADFALCSWLERMAMSGAAGFTSCCSFLAEEVRTKVGHQRWAIETIYNGIDLAAFDGAGADGFDMRGRFGVPPGMPVILFTGRLEPRKGVHLLAPVLLDVLRRSEAHAVIAGSDHFGHGRSELMPLLAKHGLDHRVHLTGRLTPADVRAALAQADVMFMPSQWEACPYACLEAMAAGKPIVASSAGGLPEILTNGVDGAIVEASDIEGYSDALLALLQQPDDARRLGQAARTTVSLRFGHDTIAEQMLRVYRRHI